MYQRSKLWYFMGVLRFTGFVHLIWTCSITSQWPSFPPALVVWICIGVILWLKWMSRACAPHLWGDDCPGHATQAPGLSKQPGGKAAGSCLGHHPVDSVSPLWVLVPNLGTRHKFRSPFLYSTAAVPFFSLPGSVKDWSYNQHSVNHLIPLIIASPI